MKLKKSQMEIMGLAIVVILISLGFIFILKFSILKKPAETHREFTQVELASNFLTSLLRTTSPDCYRLSFTELYQDCGKGPSVLCENGQDSCSYAEDKTKLILNKTLDEWNIRYDFKAYLNQNDPKVALQGAQGCPREKRSKLFPLPLGTSTMFLQMDVC